MSGQASTWVMDERHEHAMAGPAWDYVEVPDAQEGAEQEHALASDRRQTGRFDGLPVWTPPPGQPRHVEPPW